MLFNYFHLLFFLIVNFCLAITYRSLARVREVGTGSMRPGWVRMDRCFWWPRMRSWLCQGLRRGDHSCCNLLMTPCQAGCTTESPTGYIKVLRFCRSLYTLIDNLEHQDPCHNKHLTVPDSTIECGFIHVISCFITLRHKQRQTHSRPHKLQRRV